MDQWKVLSIGSVLVVWDIATSEQLVCVNFDEMFLDDYLLITLRVTVTSMLVTNIGDGCIGDNYMMLVTVLTIFVNSIRYLFTLVSSINFQKLSSTSKFSRKH